MNNSQLAAFCKVVESESVTAAAALLFCVPSNITKKIKELESEFEVMLFTRDRNRLLLTPEGRTFYQKAKQALQLEEQGRQLFTGDQLRGTLHIGALDIALSHHLPTQIAAFRTQYRDIQLNITPGYSLDLEYQLLKGERDIIFSDGPIQHPLLQSRLAFPEELVLIGVESDPALLSQRDLYVFTHQCHYRHQIDRWISQHAVIPRAVLEIESYPVIFACVRAGLGFALVPKSLAESEHLAYSVQPERIHCDIYAIWRCAHASPLLQDFIQSIPAP
ncbi:LysR family transcriptional regulator [Aeromonas hydrophila]|uniref:LysR family transcriptional regulator n=1 Tax=Aeromonas hydrophila TaxID=644 RepID=UPI00209EC2BE|nr:LysR family transcriptional regulator [Aeromonas hydrophila]MCP1268160.1 LysR family transcriptional regulator [Aeromonas hydrophila]MCP1296787.1 LysR family transcriptional regulator [Aeromonas hydrophila]